jgi:hypothetical protein
MKWQDSEKTDQTFTYVHKDTGNMTVVNSSAICRWAKGNLETVLIEPNAEIVKQVLANNGVSVANASRVSLARLDDPLLLLEWGDGCQTLADGNHRYVRAFQVGRPTIEAWFVPFADWQPFVLEGLTPELEDYLRNDVKSGAPRADQNHL